MVRRRACYLEVSIVNNYFKRKIKAFGNQNDGIVNEITGIPPLSLPNSKGKNLKSYSISGNVDEEIIGFSDSDVVLPDGYTLLDYIQSSGTQYINTNYKPNANTEIEIDFMPLVTNGVQRYFGGMSPDAGVAFGLNTDGKYMFATNNSWNYSLPYAATSRTKLKYNSNGELFIDNVKQTTMNTVSLSSAALYLFAVNYNGTVYTPATMRLYAYLISENGVLLHFYVPCINPNNEIGMYDVVSNKFYSNAGTGTFIKSPFNLLRTAGRTNQAVSGNAQTKRILQGDKYVFLTANNNVSATTEISLVEGGVSFSRQSGGHGVAFPVKLKPNHSYTAYANVSATTTTATMNIRISFYEADGTWISTWYQGNATNNGMTLKSFTVPSNSDMTLIVCAKNNTETGTAPTITFSNIMIVEGVYTTSNAPAYTPYKQLLTDCNGVGDKTKNLLLLKGRTEQTSIGGSGTSEKRILDCSKYAKGIAINNSTVGYAISNVQITADGVSCNITAVGGTVALPVKLASGLTYSISSINSSGGQIRIIYYQADGTFGGEITTTSSGIVKTFTVPSDADVTVILLRRAGSANDSPYTFSNIMLVEGSYTSSTMPTYEQFGYKIPVLSSGKNLLNGTVIRNDYVSNRSHLTEGTYIFSCDIANATKWRFVMNVYDENGNKIPSNVYNITPSMYITVTNALKVSADTTLSTIKFSLYRPADVIFTIEGGDTSASTTVTNAQIEAGNERTEYEPYVAGTINNIFITPKPEISLTGSTSFEKGTISGDGSYSSDTTRIRAKEFIPVDNNTNYILSNPAIACTTYVFLYSSADDTGYIKRLPGWASLPYTFNTESASYIKIIFKKDDGTTFEPSEIGTVVVKPIDNVQLIKAGENSDIINYPQNTITRMMGKFIFTGNENIDMYDNQHGFRFLITGMQSGMCIDGFCNRFENFNNVTDNDIPRVFFGYNNNYVYFRRVTSTSVTKADMQAILADWYLNGKPLTIWYPLENETEEAVTLPDIPTIRGNATIMIDTEVQPSEVFVKYEATSR